MGQPPVWSKEKFAAFYCIDLTNPQFRIERCGCGDPQCTGWQAVPFDREPLYPIPEPEESTRTFEGES